MNKPLVEECNLWGTKQEKIRRSQDRLVGLSLQSQTTKRTTRSLLSDWVLPERLKPVLTPSPRQMQRWGEKSEKRSNRKLVNGKVQKLINCMNCSLRDGLYAPLQRVCVRYVGCTHCEKHKYTEKRLAWGMDIFFYSPNTPLVLHADTQSHRHAAERTRQTWSISLGALNSAALKPRLWHVLWHG